MKSAECCPAIGTELPADVVLRVVAQLPARVARLVSRAARDAVDAAVESLELEPKLNHGPADQTDPIACRSLGPLLARPFVRLRTIDLYVPAWASIWAMPVFHIALRRRLLMLAQRPGRPLHLLGLSIVSHVDGQPTIPEADDLARTLAAFPRPPERLHVHVPRLCRGGEGAEELADALRAMDASASAGCAGLRDLSLSDLDSQALPAVCGALGAMTALERLALRVSLRTPGATTFPVWTAIAGGSMRRLESLSLAVAVGRFFDQLVTPAGLGAAMAALPSLRSLTVDTLVPLMDPRFAASALSALTHLSVSRHSIDAACLAQLTALRSLSAPRIGALGRAADGPAAALEALARLTALTHLALSDDYALSDEEHDSVRCPRALLPSLRVLEAGALVPLLLAEGDGALPSLTELTLFRSSFRPWSRVDVHLERRLRRQLAGADGLRQLEVLRVGGFYGDRLRLGRPSELGALTALSAAACHLRRPRTRAKWPWPLSSLSLLCRCARVQPSIPRPPSPLRLLEIRFGDVASYTDGCVAPMLRGLPALTTLALRDIKPRHVGAGSGPCSSALAGAFRGLPSLTALQVTGHAEALAAVLEAAAACPAIRAHLETVDVLWDEGQHQPAAEEMLRERIRPFAALRCACVKTSSP